MSAPVFELAAARPSPRARLPQAFALVFALGAVAACGQDEARLVNRLGLGVGIEARAPKATLRGGCSEDFRGRFCAEEYELVGVLELSAGASRTLALSDPEGSGDDGRCTDLLWLRLVRLGDVGPVDDRGTLLELPIEAEVEAGAGVIHTVAFPQATVRIDEVGEADLHQGPPPPSCAALGRSPR